MCEYMKVSRSSYYEWLQNPECTRIKEDKEIGVVIKQIFEEGRSTMVQGESRRGWLERRLQRVDLGLLG